MRVEGWRVKGDRVALIVMKRKCMMTMMMMLMVSGFGFRDDRVARAVGGDHRARHRVRHLQRLTDEHAGLSTKNSRLSVKHLRLHVKHSKLSVKHEKLGVE